MTETKTARVVLVTGGSGGIGHAVTQRLAADGMSVAVHYAGNAQRAQDAVAAIRDVGGQAMAVAADISDPGEVDAMFATVAAEFGGVDVVINTAGIMLLSPLADLDLSDLDRMVATNIRGALLVSRGAAQHVRSGGAIINLSSSVVKLAFPTYSAYAATKAAVEAVTPILAKELRGRDITVNCIAPGPTATPLFLDGKSDEQVDHMAKLAPLERLGRPEDIAEVAAWLAGPARWVNGQTLYANGGVI